MIDDGYAIVRQTTLAWLLEHYRKCESKLDPTPEVVEDLRGEVLSQIRAPTPKLDRLRAAGPVLSLEEHVSLIQSDDRLELPVDDSAGRFWRLVAEIVFTMLTNEGEAVLKIIGADHDDEG